MATPKRTVYDDMYPREGFVSQNALEDFFKRQYGFKTHQATGHARHTVTRLLDAFCNQSYARLRAYCACCNEKRPDCRCYGEEGPEGWIHFEHNVRRWHIATDDLVQLKPLLETDPDLLAGHTTDYLLRYLRAVVLH